MEGGSFPPAANATMCPPGSATPPRAGMAGSPATKGSVGSCFPAGETAEPSGFLVIGQQPELQATPRSCPQLAAQQALARASFAMRSGLAHAASNQTATRSATRIAVCRRIDIGLKPSRGSGAMQQMALGVGQCWPDPGRVTRVRTRDPDRAHETSTRSLQYPCSGCGRDCSCRAPDALSPRAKAKSSRTRGSST